jgi:amino acid adenylation domain-containing protein
MQKGLLFHSLYAPDAGVYFQQVNCVLRGKLDLQAFKQAWQQSINRHSILRTSFFWEDLEEPVQVVNRDVSLPIELEDWSELADSEQQARLHDFLEADRRRGFELSRAPLLRLALMRLDEQRYRLVWSHHHLLLDGWSIPLLLKEVFTVYRGLCWKEPVQLTQARPYRDYITWLQRQPLEEAERYWREKLRGLKSPTTLALGRGREARVEGESEYREQRLNLSAAETAELSAVARRHQLTLNTVVQGAWALLLSRYSGERDVLFGTTVAGRPAELRGVEQMVGVFINTLPVRVQIDEKKRVSEWLQDLQAEAVEMRQYEYSPLIEVAKWSEMPRGTALFESLLVFDNYPVNSNGSAASSENGKSEVPTIEDASHYRRVNYPLMLTVAPREELKWWLSYEADIFDDETISRMLDHFRQLLRGITTDPQQAIRDLSLLTDSERQQLLVEFNDTAVEFPQDVCLHQLIEQQVENTPEQTAVVFEGEQISYRELNERANQLAHHLRSLGVKAESPVGILLERSVEMVVALLGVLKAGGAYVPLDPEYPAERLRFMLEDAQVAVLITQQRLAATLPSLTAQLLRIDEEAEMLAQYESSNPELLGGAENLAYIIYTSGSTGRPKGVPVTHRNLVNFLLSMQGEPGMTAADTLLAVTTLAFDIAGLELYLPLLSGGRVALASREKAVDGQELLALLRESKATVMQATPATWRLLLSVLAAAEVKEPLELKVLCGGEALPGSLARALQQTVKGAVYNLYGPTETTIWSATHVVNEKDAETPIVSLGRPIANTQLYLLDEALQPVPVGVTAELYLGGEGLARGYLGRPELTAEKFIPDPFGKKGGGRLYRTGDLARYLPDGNIEYLVRVDHQVKIRGYRIELGEVETALREQEGVRECVVVARQEDGSAARLVSYVVLEAGASLSVTALRQGLLRRLPEYMIPASFVQLEELPLTANGKLDRRALPDPDHQRPALETEQVGPSTAVEESLVRIWSEVLRVSEVGIHDNFFELGGHSLLATQVISRVRAAFNVEIPLRTFFEEPTIAGLASQIETALQNRLGIQRPPIRSVPRGEELPLSFAQQRLWFLDQMAPGNPVYNLPLAARLTGTLNLAALQQTVDEIIRRHESLRTTFSEEDGQPRQIISPAAAVPLPIVDLSFLPEEVREHEARRLAQQEVQRPFDLVGGPLLRAGLLKLGGQEHLVLLTMHHIVSDGWSMSVLLNEVAALYAAFSRGEESPLSELMIQYADYAVWQREYLREERLEKQLDYWRRNLVGAPPALELPTDRPYPKTPTHRGAKVLFTVPAEVGEKLKALGQQEDATLFIIVLAAFAVMNSRYSGQQDIVLGTHVVDRRRVEFEQLIGLFVNTLVLRLDVLGTMSFRQLVRQSREICLGAYANQDVPFDKLVEELHPERSLSHSPFFDALLVFQNIPQREATLPGLKAEALSAESRAARFHLTLYMNEIGDRLEGAFVYNTDLFDAPTIERMAEHLQNLLRASADEPDGQIGVLGLHSKQTEAQLIYSFNDHLE